MPACASFDPIGACAGVFEESKMTLLHQHHDDLSGLARQNTFWIQKAARRVSAAFRLLHRGIVRAKLRRLHSELLFRPDYNEIFPPEKDATKWPQRPMILGDKWDF
jgi:hypothetical protein